MRCEREAAPFTPAAACPAHACAQRRPTRDPAAVSRCAALAHPAKGWWRPLRATAETTVAETTTLQDGGDAPSHPTNLPRRVAATDRIGTPAHGATERCCEDPKWRYDLTIKGLHRNGTEFNCAPIRLTSSFLAAQALATASTLPIAPFPLSRQSISFVSARRLYLPVGARRSHSSSRTRAGSRAHSGVRQLFALALSQPQ